MKQKLRSTLSVVLAMAMGLSSISVPALAEESEPATEAVVESVVTADETADAAEEIEVTEKTEEPADNTATSEEGEDVAPAVEEAYVEETENNEDNSNSSFNADIVLSDYSSSDDVKSVSIQAYADSKEDTCGYIFFWQYDGTFPEDASAWAGYFNTPYYGITADEIDEDFSEIYLPVTLADGSAGGASTEMIHADNYACVAFDMPAGSSMNTTLSLSLTDEIEDDLHVMLEAAYVDSYKNDLITTDYLPLDWEGNEIDETVEEEVPFDEDDEEFAVTEEDEEATEDEEAAFEDDETESESESEFEFETQSEEESEEESETEDDTASVTLSYSEGGTILASYDDEDGETIELSELSDIALTTGTEIDVPDGSSVDFSVEADEGNYISGLRVYYDDGTVALEYVDTSEQLDNAAFDEASVSETETLEEETDIVSDEDSEAIEWLNNTAEESALEEETDVDSDEEIVDEEEAIFSDEEMTGDDEAADSDEEMTDDYEAATVSDEEIVDDEEATVYDEEIADEDFDEEFDSIDDTEYVNSDTVALTMEPDPDHMTSYEFSVETYADNPAHVYIDFYDANETLYEIEDPDSGEIMTLSSNDIMEMKFDGSFAIYAEEYAYVPEALAKDYPNARTTYRYVVFYDADTGEQAECPCYCVQPAYGNDDLEYGKQYDIDKATSLGGSNASDKNQLMTKCFYYMFGGPMWGKTVTSDDESRTFNLKDYLDESGYGFNQAGEKSSASDDKAGYHTVKHQYYAFTHYVLGYIWSDGDSSIWNGRSGHMNVLNGSGETLIKRVVSILEQLPYPTAKLNHSSVSATTLTTDSSYQSDTVKYTSVDENYISTTLPAGITLVDSTTDTTYEPGSTARVYGGDKFYFIVDPSTAQGKVNSSGEKYTTITFTAKYSTTFEAYVFKLSGEQDMGFAYYGDDTTLELELSWPNNGYLKLIKDTDNTTVVEGNDMYSLEGAEYAVYNSNGSIVATLTTKADGTTDAVELEVGTYTVKETKAPKGYELDTEEHTVEVTS